MFRHLAIYVGEEASGPLELARARPCFRPIDDYLSLSFSIIFTSRRSFLSVFVISRNLWGEEGEMFRSPRDLVRRHALENTTIHPCTVIWRRVNRHVFDINKPLL